MSEQEGSLDKTILPKTVPKRIYQERKQRHDKKLVVHAPSLFELWCQAFECGDVRLMKKYRRRLIK